MGEVSRAHSKKSNNRKTKLGGKIKEREKVNGRRREVYDQIFGRLKGVSVAHAAIHTSLTAVLLFI